MKEFTFGILFYLSFCSTAYSQQRVLNGTLIDSLLERPIKDGTLMLLHQKDSFLYKFTYSDSSGKFQFNNIDTGKYLLVVSFPKYVDYIGRFQIDTSYQSKYFLINMILRSTLLENVIVRSNVASIKVRGDTTEFVADSFKLNKNASVEDLLKRLPTIEVDQSGNITAQGQKVKKVLLDGEEFFGDDPTLFTQNIKADMIDKVQVFDKKSAQAAFTGIDDGIRDKTLNFTLKKNRKVSVFGKLGGGVGTNRFYESQNMLNSFQAKNKVSVFGTFANTGKVGLGLGDAQKYNSFNNKNSSFSSSGAYFTTTGNEDIFDSWDGIYTGEGIPRVYNIGVHAEKKSDDDCNNLTLNAKTGGSDLNANTSMNMRNNLGNGIVFVTNGSSISNKRLLKTTGDITHQLDLDSTFYIKTELGGISSQSKVNEGSKMTTSYLSGDDVNSIERYFDSRNGNNAFGGNTLIGKKISSEGRNVSLAINSFFQETITSGILNSYIEYFQTKHSRNVDQKIDSRSNVGSVGTTFTYTEPISKNASLGLKYRYTSENSKQLKETYNKGITGSYSEFDSIYSFDYKITHSSHLSGLSYNYNKSRLSYNLGVEISSITLRLSNQNSIGNNFSKRFINWFPNFSITYKFKNQLNFSARYNGYSTQPAFNQLNPFFTANDTLNIYVGNPNLKPSFSNYFFLNLSKFKATSNTYLGIFGSANVTSSPVTVDVQVDTITGRNLFTYSNYERNTTTFFLNGTFATKLKKADLDYQLNIALNGNRYYTSSNSNIIRTSIAQYSISNKFSKLKENNYGFSIQGIIDYSYNRTISSLSLDNSGWGVNFLSAVDKYLKKFLIHTEINYRWKGKTKAFQDEWNVLLWNAWLERRFLKKENFLMRIRVNDILNRNEGFSRTANNNIISETKYNTIKRYALLSIVWEFNKNNK